jgi:hypothetical protein
MVFRFLSFQILHFLENPSFKTRSKPSVSSVFDLTISSVYMYEPMYYVRRERRRKSVY